MSCWWRTFSSSSSKGLLGARGLIVEEIRHFSHCFTETWLEGMIGHDLNLVHDARNK